MRLDLTRYRKPSDHFGRAFEPGEVGSEADAYRVVAPVDLAFDILKDRDVFRLVGTVKGDLELTCSRCLEPFGLPIDSAFDVRYFPAEDASASGEQEVGEGELETSYYEGSEIDLNALLREQFYLALPMKPLCEEQCQGLCPQCGTNLNDAACGCQTSWTDSRLAVLKGLGKTRES